jgi:hypothetical protein
MSNLTNIENRKFEQLLDMGSGYVLNFSNRTFDEFVTDSTGRNVYDARYDYGSGSKANRLRGFWREEPNGVVGKLMDDLLDYGVENDLFTDKDTLLEACRRVVTRLLQDSPVPEADALAAISNERDFDTVARAVREAIATNEPEPGLDRLHTFVVKYVRTLCTRHNITIARDKPLHSLFGEYVKRLRDGGHIQSEMAERILRTSISTLQAFNDVRNNQSLAHDNPILDYDEALLIFNHVASSIRYLRSLEGRLQKRSPQAPFHHDLDDIPF